MLQLDFKSVHVHDHTRVHVHDHVCVCVHTSIKIRGLGCVLDEEDSVDLDGGVLLVAADIADVVQGLEAEVERDLRGREPGRHPTLVDVLQAL